MTTRWKIIIEYNGTNYVGWQRQKNGLSVQEAIEKAILDFSGESIKIEGSGRTDARVHAIGQVAHFDLEKDIDPKNVRNAINQNLKGHDIAILNAVPVEDSFHARFLAKKRHYCYRMTCNRHAPIKIDELRSWHIKHDLDLDAMREASKHLIGEHDFSTFRAAKCQSNSPIKRIDSIEIEEEPHYLIPGRQIFIKINGLSFLHHQIRNIAGSLKLVGSERWTPREFKKAFEAKDRTRGGQTAPAHGLYFVKVDY